MGTAAASAGAARISEGLRAGLSSWRTKPEYTAAPASGPHDYRSGPTTGTRSQTTGYVRRGTGRVVQKERWLRLVTSAIIHIPSWCAVYPYSLAVERKSEGATQARSSHNCCIPSPYILTAKQVVHNDGYILGIYQVYTVIYMF